MSSDEKPFVLKPSDFLRKRRPDQYSDSVVKKESNLTSDLLEYHLDTLTNRSQEKEFEHFSRRLCEKVLCPNLLPQTGSTGGGDSKVDSETYPVADDISALWYHGDASAKQRWAFAISAQKEWRRKIKDDVRKIVKTGRNYALIYFISNQFIRDKIRAEVEDSLGEEFNIEVRILDRTWIVEQIIDKNNIDIAVLTLDIQGLKSMMQTKTGPRDASKKVMLAELDERVSNVKMYEGLKYQLAEDCLASAILASEIGIDIKEVSGRFAVAENIAKQNGDERQILRVLYKYAWFMCFNYDDLDTTFLLYDKVEELALKSAHSEDVEKLHNLWNVLSPYGFLEDSPYQSEDIMERGRTLRAKLVELSEDDTKPNNALNARTMRCFLDIYGQKALDDELPSVSEIFRELYNVFENSDGLGQYPFSSYKRLVFEIGEHFPDDDDYEKLCDLVASLHEIRTSEGETGVILVDRAIQKLAAKRPNDAIKLFGRAETKLVKDEYKSDLVFSLVGCGGAYDSLGLSWASRSTLLAALTICGNEMAESGYMHRIAVTAAKKIVWIEVRKGRVPQFIYTLMIANFCANHADYDEKDETVYRNFIEHVDQVFAILLLRSNIEQLEKIGKLPHILNEVGLPFSEGALLFCLGHIDELKNGKWFSENATDGEILDAFKLLYEQPANADLPENVDFGLCEKSEIKSVVLGVQLIMKIDDLSNSILIAESFLGAIESFFATCLISGILPHVEKVTVEIRANQELEEGIKFDVSGDGKLSIIHAPSFLGRISTSQHANEIAIKSFITYFLTNCVVIRDCDSQFTELFEKDNVFGRSLLFAGVSELAKEIVGGDEGGGHFDLYDEENLANYELKRELHWLEKDNIKIEDAVPSSENQNSRHIRHDQRTVVSLIDIPIWDKASWVGIMFLIDRSESMPPCLGLMYESEKAARKIFSDWRERVSEIDVKNEIRVSIVRDTDQNFPSHYSINIGSDREAFLGKGNEIASVSRIHRLESQDDNLFKEFVEAFKTHGSYYLLPAIFEDGMIEPNRIHDLAIKKSKLVIREAWDIGENDEDLAVLDINKIPIIPVGSKFEDTPAFQAIEKLKKMPLNS